MLNFATLLQHLSLNRALPMLKIQSQKNLQYNILFSTSLRAENGPRETYSTHTKNFNINNINSQPSSHWLLRNLIRELSFISRFIIKHMKNAQHCMLSLGKSFCGVLVSSVFYGNVRILCFLLPIFIGSLNSITNFEGRHKSKAAPR